MRFIVVSCLFLVPSVALFVGLGPDLMLPGLPFGHANGGSGSANRSDQNKSSNPSSPPGPSTKQDLTMLANASCLKPTLSCAARGSCSEPVYATTKEFTCYCDSHCESFQDCCHDYLTSRCTITERGRNLTNTKNDFVMSCVDLGDSSYWMKNSCSKSWPNNNVSSLCIHPPSRLNSSTYMDFLPVLGSDNITYRNRHCAKCNYQNTFELWMLNSPLSFQPVGIGSTEDLIDFFVKLKGNEGVLNAVVPKLGMSHRYCRKIISNCSNVSNLQTVNHCTFGGVALMFAGNEEHFYLYKNKYCAFCNDYYKLDCKSMKGSELPVSDFFLTINFKHKSQSSGYSVNPACPSRIYDHHLKACLKQQDIVAPVDSLLDKYKIAVWFLWPYSNMPNISHFHNFLTDVEPSNISNGVLQKVQEGIQMIRFDVQLTSNQSFELLENTSKVETTSTGAYSISKFVKPFVSPFAVRLGSKTVTVIKTTSRQLGCIGLQVFKPSDYKNIGQYDEIYVHKTNRNYTRDQYFKDQSSNGLIRVCEKQLPNDCDGFYREYSRNEFEVRPGLLLHHQRTGVLYKFGQYTLNNNTVHICHIAVKDDDNVIREYLTLVGLGLSLVSLIIVLVTYLTFSELRTPPGKNIINLSIGLVLMDVIWLVSPQAVKIRQVCIAAAFGMQYFMLLAHVNMAKIGYDTLRMFTDPLAHQRTGSTRLKFFVLLWIIPLAFVLLSFILWHFKIFDVQYTEACWLSGQYVFAMVYIPLCLAMAFNIICLTRSICEMRKLERNGQLLRAQKQEKSSVFIYIKISTLLGLGWASIFIAVFLPVFSYVFVALTTLQGFYIFLAFVCKRNVLTLYRNLVCGKREEAPDPMRKRSVTNVL